MPSELVKRVRAKYPDAYRDLDDATLERLVLAKYPEYRDLAQPPPESAPPLGPIAKAGAVLGDVAGGARAGLASTIYRGGDLIRRRLGLERVIDRPAVQAAMTAPEGTAGQVGFYGEQIAEALAPTRLLARTGAKAAQVVAPMLERAIGTTAARVLPIAAVDAAGAAGVSSLQGGDPAVAAGLGAVLPMAGTLAGKTSAALRSQAGKQVVQALGPTKERFKAMAERLAPEMLRRGVRGSREAVQAQAAETAERIGGQIDDAIQQFGDRAVDTTPILAALEHAKDAFRTTTTLPLAEAMRTGAVKNAGARIVGHTVELPVVFEPRAVNQLTGLQGILRSLGEDARVDQLVAIRRAWDKVVDQAGGFTHRASGAIGVPLNDQSEAWAKREATTAIRKVLNTDVPELGALNKEFSFWKSLDDVLTQTLKRTQPHGKGLLRQTAEVGGQVVGGLAGSQAGPAGTIGGAIAFGKLTNFATTVLHSPRWKLASAHLKDALADALMSEQPGRIAYALGRIAAVQGSKVPAALTAP